MIWISQRAQTALLVSLLVWFLGGLGARAGAAPTNVAVRDPSKIIQQDGTYHLFGTGTGIPQFASRDRLTWTPLGPALPQAPAWLSGAVPQNRGNVAWAPDVAFFGGEYRLYSSYSSLGSKRSAIGLSTNKTLDPTGWVDRGIVIQSGEETSFNALDPGVFQGEDGKWWLTLGSYFDGIHIVELDARTGKRVAGGPMTRLASRPGAAGNLIEASTAFFHEGWYYLFTNWDSCLQGPRSTYNIRVCRSKSPTGPYEDRTGKRALQGGGSLFLASVVDDRSGRPFDEQVGPGHVGIMQEGESFTLSTHLEWSSFLQGKTTVNVQKLAWDSDGWPRAVLDNGPFQIVSRLGTYPIMEARGVLVQTGAYEAQPGQKWTLKHLGDGFYAIANASSGLVLGTVGGTSKPGARVELAAFQNFDWQKWLARQNEDGTYTFLLQSGGQNLALDVPGGSLNEGTPLAVWSDNFAPAQKWSFRAR